MKPDFKDIIQDLNYKLNDARWWITVCKDFVVEHPTQENKESLSEAEDIQDAVEECIELLVDMQDRMMKNEQKATA